MKRKAMVLVAGAILTSGLAVILLPGLVMSHCQMPCGIYDDPARVAQLYEDAATIEKAVTQINDLSGKSDPQSANQLVRWVNTKEEHAAAIITTVSEYFLAQRVKPVEAGGEGRAAYLQQLAEHHAIIIAAMKTKQNADSKYVTDLRASIDAIAKYYNIAEHEH